MIIQKSFGLSDVGRRREANEDQFLLEDPLLLYAVADGMGGHAAGEIASQLAIDSLRESIEKDRRDDGIDPGEAKRMLEVAFKNGNQQICDSVRSRNEWQGMGTTIVALLFAGDTAVVGHVGDSRAYLLRDGSLRRLTSDHSWVNEQVKLGLLTDEEAQQHPMRNIVTRALGNRTELEIETGQAQIQDGDLFMLCSDGLNSMINDDAICRSLSTHLNDPEKAAQALIDEANQAGGDDNITVIVIRAEANQESAK
jgi:serine/threonine protein phosphatase PrpC